MTLSRSKLAQSSSRSSQSTQLHPGFTPPTPSSPLPGSAPPDDPDPRRVRRLSCFALLLAIGLFAFLTVLIASPVIRS